VRERWANVQEGTIAVGATHVSHLFPNMVHVVFSTKDRRKIIPPEFQRRLWAYVSAICQRQNIFVHAVGGTENHIHFLLQVPATLALAKAVLLIKSNSSRWATQSGQKLTWQEGYGAFSVSASVMPTVVKYIENQKEHHPRMSFDEELLSLLKKHGVKFDSEFVFG
jgi:putative transposase